MTDEAGGELVTAERPAPAGDLVGKRWATQYRIARLIGGGGMGEVWAAASEDLPGQLLAVKVIAAEHAHRRDAVERFFGEARAASALDDQNVVKIFDTGRLDDGRPVLIMEHVDGPSLQAMVDAGGPLPLDTIGQLAIQAASALRTAHARGIIHRDIKPSNLLVTSRWGRAAFLVVVDFGIAKLADPELAGPLRTRTRTFIGTPGFAAPEQALGKPIDAKADIYALGVVLYYLLAGRLPYEGDSALETLNLQIAGAPFRAPIELRPDTPPAWNALVRDCLQVDPGRRPTAVELARRIAAGLPNGEALLEALAPMIAIHRGRSAAFAATLSHDVPTALAQLGAARAAAPPRSRGGRAAKLAVFVGGVLVGCLAPLVALRLAAPATTPAPDAAPAPDAIAIAPVPDGPAPDAPLPDAPAIVPMVDAAPAAPRPDAGTPARVARPPEPEPPKAARAARGRLVIAVSPFADVFIDGRLVGSTPLDVLVPAGPHTVRLVNGPRGRDRTFSVTVDPQKPVILEESW